METLPVRASRRFRRGVPDAGAVVLEQRRESPSGWPTGSADSLVTYSQVCGGVVRAAGGCRNPLQPRCWVEAPGTLSVGDGPVRDRIPCRGLAFGMKSISFGSRACCRSGPRQDFVTVGVVSSAGACATQSD